MHKKYGPEQLACMSVSVDVPEDRDGALKFLQEQQAAFTNLLLDEPTSFWQDKFRISGPPAVFVFDRDGKWVRFDGDGPGEAYTYADIDKLVRKLLDARPSVRKE